MMPFMCGSGTWQSLVTLVFDKAGYCSSNVLDLNLGGAWFKSQQEHWLS